MINEERFKMCYEWSPNPVYFIYSVGSQSSLIRVSINWIGNSIQLK